MTDTPRKFGIYEVEREVGRGGMGVVYLARDPKLDRPVAIKVLPAEVAQDPERLARFEREARLLASLNHPNIGGIYGIEEADGTRFLVLEYLDGPTLADRLKSGALTVEEAMDVSRQIAAALEVAHENGVIHRDLKPANVKLTSEGGVKVLDFGLAKGAGTAESSSDLSHSPTLTAHATSAGVILGTAAYMSPEQARGKTVDRRTDIWSFGCVLYECLTGRQLFAGETVSDTIAKILEREPDWSALPAGTPERVVDLLRRCLEKDPRKRQRDMGDARLHMEEVEQQRTSKIRAAQESGRHEVVIKRSRRATTLAWAFAIVFAVIAMAALRQAGMFGGKALDPAVRFTISGEPGARIFWWPSTFVISPDGSHVVWIGTDSLGVRGLRVRALDSLEPRILTGTAQAGLPFWSWDGQHIGFFDNERLRRIALDGDEPEIVCNAVSTRGGGWGKDWIIFAGEQGPIYKVAPGGGEPVAVTRLDESRGETAHRFPHFLPDGKTFLYAALPGRSGRVNIFASDVDGREPVPIVEAVACPTYAEPGYLLIQRGGRILAQRFDAKALQLSGDPVVLGPAPEREAAVGAPVISASRNGHLALITPQDQNDKLVWLDRRGRVIEELDVDPATFRDVRISPDGRHVALEVEVSPEEADIWVLELDRLVLTRLTFGEGRSADPVWSPDGKWIAYSNDREGPWNIYRKPFPGGGDPEPVVMGPALFKNPLDWSSDGRHLLYEQIGAGTNMDLWIAPLDGGEPRAYLATAFQEIGGRLSGDGRWIVYRSFETGLGEIYINSFPEPGAKHRVSIDGGNLARWGPGDREVEYRRRDVVMRATVQFMPLRTGAPREAHALPAGGGSGDYSPDQTRYLQARQATAATPPSGTIILNWASILED